MRLLQTGCGLINVGNKENMMKNMNMLSRLFTLAAVLTVSLSAAAQKKGEDPQGFLTYSLPSTTITLEVEAVQEKFYAGPYGK